MRPLGAACAYSMTRLDHLPPDQRAALSLLLRRRKSYAEVAALLGISEDAVQQRAHAALDALANGSTAPPGREQLTAQQRAEIGDYLLGQQQGVAERLRTRTHLDASQPARDWASALTSELASLASVPLPEIPAGPSPQPAGEPPSPPAEPDLPPAVRGARSLPSSRLGGALLLTAIITGIIVAVVLATGEGGSGGSHNASTPANSASTPATSSPHSATSTTPTGATASNTTGATGTSTGGPSEQARIALVPTDRASKTVGVAVILAEGSQHAFYLAAERVPPTNGFFYAVWLYNSPTSFEALGKSPPVSSNGRMQGGALLPSNAASFHQMIVTRETTTKPPRPGPIILSGALKLGR